jgi:hypothetical protein
MSRLIELTRSRYSSWRIGITSGDDERTGCWLQASVPGWWLQLRLPPILLPYRVKVKAGTWDAATIARLGRDWYWDIYPREFSVSYGEGYVHAHYGRQTGDSSTERSWCKELPWMAWRFVRHSLFDLDGNRIADEPDGPFLETWDERQRLKAAQPKAYFEFRDYDGQVIRACCRVEEREWLRGRGWFKGLSLFYAPKVHRSVDIAFSAEVGHEKGSWKGGTLGHGIETTAGESVQAAFERYCRQQKLEFIGPSEAWAGAPDPERNAAA